MSKFDEYLKIKRDFEDAFIDYEYIQINDICLRLINTYWQQGHGSSHRDYDTVEIIKAAFRIYSRDHQKEILQLFANVKKYYYEKVVLSALKKANGEIEKASSILKEQDDE